LTDDQIHKKTPSEIYAGNAKQEQIAKQTEESNE